VEIENKFKWVRHFRKKRESEGEIKNGGATLKYWTARPSMVGKPPLFDKGNERNGRTGV